MHDLNGVLSIHSYAQRAHFRALQVDTVCKQETAKVHSHVELGNHELSKVLGMYNLT